MEKKLNEALNKFNNPQKDSIISDSVDEILGSKKQPLVDEEGGNQSQMPVIRPGIVCKNGRIKQKIISNND
jgi:hypothetical protein